MLKRTILLVVGAFFLWGTLSCGTLIYPERRGQRSGRIDPAVAILDGIGLLVFIIPGLVAYAIDFSTGAIYLPGTRASGGWTGDMTVLQAEGRTWEALATAIERRTGSRPDLTAPGLQVYRAERPDPELGAALAALAAGQPAAPSWTACSIGPDGALTTADGRLVGNLSPR